MGQIPRSIERISSFERDFDPCSLLADRLLWTLTLTTERTAYIHYWNIWSVDEKFLQSLIRYYWIFRTRLFVQLKKWTLSLNCCLFWTTCVISTKFAGYVDWIRLCKLCKFGKYICYNSRDIEFFLRVPFLARPVYFHAQLRIRVRNTKIWTMNEHSHASTECNRWFQR